MREGWKSVRLSEICTNIQYGYTASAQTENIGPKFLRITDVVGDLISWQTVPYCPISQTDFEKYRLDVGDIVVARTGNTTGHAKLIRQNVNAVFASYLIRFKVDKNKAYHGFIGRLIESGIFKNFVRSVIGGSAQPGVNAKVLGNFLINLPPLPTQRKIASILSAYDDLIENNLKRIKLLEEKAQLTYEEWFVRMKFPGHENAVWDEESGLPEGWEKLKLQEFAEIIMGQSPKSEFYNDVGFGLPFHQGVKDFGTRFPSNKTWSKQGSRIAKKGSILFSVRAPVGRINITNENIVLGRGLAALNQNEGFNTFLYYQLKQIFFEDNLIGGGAIYNSVTKKDMQNIIILVPKKELTKLFNDGFSKLDRSIENLFGQNQLLKEARDILLPRLMMGMVDVEDLLKKPPLNEMDRPPVAEPEMGYAKT